MVRLLLNLWIGLGTAVWLWLGAPVVWVALCPLPPLWGAMFGPLLPPPPKPPRKPPPKLPRNPYLALRLAKLRRATNSEPSPKP